MTRKALIKKSYNHPDGGLKPSDEDQTVTQDLAKACQTIDIRLFDHIIIISISHFSFKENEML